MTNPATTKLSRNLIGRVVTLQRFTREGTNSDSLKPDSLYSVTGRLQGYKKYNKTTFVKFEGVDEEGWIDDYYYVEWWVDAE
jgi:hypothetical protein